MAEYTILQIQEMDPVPLPPSMLENQLEPLHMSCKRQ